MIDRDRELKFLHKCRQKIGVLVEMWLEMDMKDYSLDVRYVFEDSEHSPVSLIRLEVPNNPDLSSIHFLCTQNTDNNVKLEWLESWS